jgi:hypothetical protein
MKPNIKHLILIICFSFGFASFAQNNAIDKYFSSYYDMDDFTTVNISSKMFSLFTMIEGETEEDQEVLDCISQLTSLRILSTDREDLYPELNAIAKKIPTKEYEELMSIHEKDQDVLFIIKEKDDVITELLVLAYGEKQEFTIISLMGVIDLDKISKLSKGMNVGGLKHLEKIDNKKEK